MEGLGWGVVVKKKKKTHSCAAFYTWQAGPLSNATHSSSWDAPQKVPDYNLLLENLWMAIQTHITLERHSILDTSGLDPKVHW